MAQDTTQCAALAVHDLSAGYPGAAAAVQHITFDLKEGERVGLFGPNGAGKSTLFKAIVGLIPHDTGHISMYGQDCRTSHEMVGYVPQNEAIDWDFPVTVRDVVMMGRARHIGWFRWPRRRDWEAVGATLERVGMADFQNRQIGQLSGGQRRRAFIARALAQETNVLLLDEPFSGVDAAAEDDIFSTLARLRRDGVAVVLATHDLSLADRFDKIMLMNRQLVAFGAPAAAFTPETLTATYGGRVGIFEQGDDRMMILDEHGCIGEEKG